MSKKELGLDKVLMRNAERHFDAVAFEKLYSLAVDVCLEKSPIVPETQPPATAEAQLFQKLGLRGLGMAFNVLEHPYSYNVWVEDREPEPEDDNDSLVYVTDLHPLYYPRAFCTEADTEIQTKIKSFGEQLLTEAFTCLGPDASEMVAQFDAAENDDEQIQVLEWLYGRIKAIQRLAEYDAKASDDELFYHPIRLSPKAIGKFPAIGASPTCLGVSILAQSFIEKTKARGLHAGVMMLTQQREEDNFAEVLYEARLTAELPDIDQERIKEVEDKIKYGVTDRGIHAASVVQLLSGRWYVIDPNYRTAHVFTRGTFNQHLSEAADQIDEISHLAPGLERVVSSDDVPGLSDYAYYLQLRMRKQKYSNEYLASLLEPADIEDFFPSIYQYVRASIEGIKLPKSKSRKFYKEVLGTITKEHDNGSYPLEDVMVDVWHDWFLRDEAPEVVIDRIARDPAYKQRRLEDLKHLPMIAYLSSYLSVLPAFTQIYSRDQHYTLEVGAPAYRIGAAVLSDFSTYCGNELSYGFWMTHWPSIVPVTERAVDASSDQSAEYVDDALIWLRHYWLKYYNQNGIIQELRPRD